MSPTDPAARTCVVLRIACVLYAALIVHVSLMPWHGWHLPAENVLSFLAQPLVPFSRLSFIVNVFAYIPLGALLLASERRRRNGPVTVALAACAGVALSFAMELWQWYVPGRDAATIDIVANGGGTFIGAGVAEWVVHDGRPYRWLARILESLPEGGIAGLVALATWALAELSPLLPVYRQSQLHGNLLPAIRVTQGTYDWRPYLVCTYAFYLMGALLLARRLHIKFTWSIVAAAVVLALRTLVVNQGFQPEGVAGLLIAVIVHAIGIRLHHQGSIAILLFIAGFITYEVEPGHGPMHPFLWVPFQAANEMRITAFANIFWTAWPFAAMAAVARLNSSPRTARIVSWWGALSIGAGVFLLERTQLHIPGRYGDITTVFLALSGWVLAWLLPDRKRPDRAGEVFAPAAKIAYGQSSIVL